MVQEYFCVKFMFTSSNANYTQQVLEEMLFQVICIPFIVNTQAALKQKNISLFMDFLRRTV
jgi:hypothetical protein